MAILRRSPRALPPINGLVGPVRFARRDIDVDALEPGDIVIVDYPDIGARHAQTLIDHRVAAVLNGAKSTTGRVPNRGPQMLAAAGIPLIDLPGTQVAGLVKEGERVRLENGRLFRDDTLILAGIEMDASRAAADLVDAESNLASNLASVVANASAHIHREHDMLIDGARIPRLRTKLRRRPAVVVSRRFEDADDLRGLKRFIAEREPALIGAGVGADVLLDAGYSLDVLVGRLDHLSDRAIAAAHEVVVVTPTGRVESPERLEKHGKQVVSFLAGASDDDAAILLADTNEAAVIVHVGAPASMADFLESGSTDASLMFVTRLRSGSKLVDASAVHFFSTSSRQRWPIFALLLGGLASVAVAVATTPTGADWFSSLGDWLQGIVA